MGQPKGLLLFVSCILFDTTGFCQAKRFQVVCPGENISWFGQQVHWDEAVIDSMVTVSCPFGGLLTRHCKTDPSSSSKGRWGDVVPSPECMHPPERRSGGDTCSEDKDSVAGSSLSWATTPVGTTASKSCPTGSISGNVSRVCVLDQTAPSGGRWEEPDVSQCSNNIMKDFYESALYQVNQRPGRADVTISLMNDLQMIVNDASLNQTLYPTDLYRGTDIMDRISVIAHGLKGIHKQIDVLAQTYGDAMSSLTSRQTLAVWYNGNEKENLMETATTILQATEQLAINLLNTKFDRVLGQVEWTTLRINSSTLDFEVLSYPEEFHTIQEFTLSGDNESTQIIFPEEVVNGTASRANGGIYGFYRGQFLTIKDIFNHELSSFIANTSDVGKHSVEMDSPVISARPLGVDTKHFQNLSQPVILIFKHQTQEQKVQRGSCRFLNTSAEGGAERWSDEGCKMAVSNDTHTICHCYHLTNFALLMNLFKVNLSAADDVALTFISYIGGTLSVIGCTVSIVTYEWFRLSGDCIRVHEMLALSIVLTQVTFFIGVQFTHHQVVCRVLAIMLHAFLISMFCWMLVEGIHLYICLVKVFRSKSNFKKYCLVGWGIPLAIVGVSVMVFFDDYGGNISQICWVTNRVTWIALVPFVVITMAINIVVLIVVLRTMHKSITSAARNKIEDIPMARAGVKATVILMPLLGLTWCFGFLSIDARGTLVFTYLFTISNSFQGVFFFIFHCLKNNEVKRAFDRQYQRQRNYSSSGNNRGMSREKTSPEPGKKSLTGERSTSFIGTVPSPDDSPQIHYADLSKKCSSHSNKSTETNITNLDEGMTVDDDISKMGFSSSLRRRESVKQRKDLDNLFHKLENDIRVSHYCGDDLTYIPDLCSEAILEKETKREKLKENEINEALAAMDSAIRSHSDNMDICCISHM